MPEKVVKLTLYLLWKDRQVQHLEDTFSTKKTDSLFMPRSGGIGQNRANAPIWRIGAQYGSILAPFAFILAPFGKFTFRSFGTTGRDLKWSTGEKVKEMRNRHNMIKQNNNKRSGAAVGLLLLSSLLLPGGLWAQNQAVNGNMNVTGITYGAQGIGLGTTTAPSTYSGRKWWAVQGSTVYSEMALSTNGRISGFLFNAYSTANGGGLDGAGNIKHASNEGDYSNGAGLIKYTGNGGSFLFRISEPSEGIGTDVVWNNIMGLHRNGRAIFYGNVGIGTTNPQAKLAVNGNILAKEVKVKTNISVPDYVFEEGYKLPDLKELETYVRQHKHLPEVPTAAEIGRDGLDLAAMNLLLLKKVEELTLQLMQVNSKVDRLIEEKQ